MFALVLLTGCTEKSTPVTHETKAKQIQEQIATANNALAAGQVAQAIKQLEQLDQRTPNHPDILEALAFAYAAQPDPMLAAFYFEQVFKMAPERTELLPYAAKTYAQEQEWEAAASAYTRYLKEVPDDVNAAYALAIVYSEMGQIDNALKAYLNAVEATERKPTAAEATRLGNMFRAQGNNARAGDYYAIALEQAEAQPPLAALAGLFELAVNREQAERAETLAAQIEEQQPGTLSKLPAYSRFQAQMVEVEAARRAEEQAAAEAEAAKTEAQAVAEDTETRPDSEDSATTETSDTTSLAEDTTDPTNTTQASPKESGDASSSSIADTPANEAPVAAAPAEPEQETSSRPRPVQPEPTHSVSDLVAMASEARTQGDDARAIALNWEAVNREHENSESWYELSRSYLASGQLARAEATILEAMRLAPKNVRYRLSYLKIVQMTQPPATFMQELEKAHDALPDSPDIVLQLARGYDRILKNRRDAHFLYSRFIEMAPRHPERESAEEAIRKLYN